MGTAELKLSNPLYSCCLLACEPVTERRSRGTTHPEPVSPNREVPSWVLRGAFYPHCISNTSIKLQGWVTRDLMFCNERLIFQELYLGARGLSSRAVSMKMPQWWYHIQVAKITTYWCPKGGDWRMNFIDLAMSSCYRMQPYVGT